MGKKVALWPGVFRTAHATFYLMHGDEVISALFEVVRGAHGMGLIFTSARHRMPCSPQAANAVSIERGIGSHDWDRLDQGLRDEEAIEWVAVVTRQAGLDSRMLDRDGQDSKFEFGDHAIDPFAEGARQL